MQRTFSFFTDAATLAIFDPMALESRRNDEVDWWTANLHKIDETANGNITLISLSGDGVYTIRITTEDLTPDERDFAKEVVKNLGLRVISGTAFVGKAECLPSGGNSPSPQNIHEGEGEFIVLDNGEYDLTVYSIEPPDLEEAVSISDIVVTIQPRTTAFVAQKKEPRIFTGKERYLFPSQRVKELMKPKVGKVLKAKVILSGSNLKLREDGAWPYDLARKYTVTLDDFSEVKWHDRIEMSIESINESEKTVVCKLLRVTKNHESTTGETSVMSNSEKSKGGAQGKVLESVKTLLRKLK